MSPSPQPQLHDEAKRAKFRTWIEDPKKASVMTQIHHMITAMDVKGIKKQMIPLETRMEDLYELLQQTQAHDAKSSKVISQVNEALQNREADLSTMAQKVELIDARCKHIEMTINTLQNGHSGLESKLEKYLIDVEKMKGTCDSLAENVTIDPAATTPPTDDVEVASLLRDYKDCFKRFVELVDSPEKLDFLGSLTYEMGKPELPIEESVACQNIEQHHCVSGGLSDPSQKTVVHKSPVPKALRRFVEILDRFDTTYQRKRPRHEDSFVLSFLEAIDARVANYLQKKILFLCPFARLAQPQALRGRSGIPRIVDVKKVTWKEVCRLCDHGLDFEELARELHQDAKVAFRSFRTIEKMKDRDLQPPEPHVQVEELLDDFAL